MLGGPALALRKKPNKWELSKHYNTIKLSQQLWGPIFCTLSTSVLAAWGVDAVGNMLSLASGAFDVRDVQL